MVFDLTIVPIGRKLRAATHGNGIYERKLYSNPVSVQQIGSEVPQKLFLYQNYPNPFNPVTHIKYQIPAGDLNPEGKIFVSLNIYNVQGKLVQKLVNEMQSPGVYDLIFNAKNLPSGIYFYKLSTQKSDITRKMLILK